MVEGRSVAAVVPVVGGDGREAERSTVVQLIIIDACPVFMSLSMISEKRSFEVEGHSHPPKPPFPNVSVRPPHLPLASLAHPDSLLHPTNTLRHVSLGCK